VAAFFSEGGSLRVNDDPPAVGQARGYPGGAVVHDGFSGSLGGTGVMDDLLVRGARARTNEYQSLVQF
jgi:hypothetical protein